jgi:CBS-domain-containing membrane protein
VGSGFTGFRIEARRVSIAAINKTRWIMKVEALMMQGVAACKAEDQASEAAGLMWERDCGVIPVVDEDARVVAVVTDRDLCMASYMEGKSLQDIPVGNAMSKELWSCRRDDDVTDAERVMREHQVRRVPVVDADGHLEGILSLSDIVREASKEAASKVKKPDVRYTDVAKTLSDINEPHHAAREVVKAS